MSNQMHVNICVCKCTIMCDCIKYVREQDCCVRSGICLGAFVHQCHYHANLTTLILLHSSEKILKSARACGEHRTDYRAREHETALPTECKVLLII